MNILLMTSVYPDAENTSNENVTKVVKYFAESWSGFGHNVYVVHNSHKYPNFVHKLPPSLKKKIATKINFYIPDYCDVCKKEFSINGIEGIRLPILKLRPHKKVSDNQVSKQVRLIIEKLDSIGFVPDIIISHWVCPQAQLLEGLRARWKNVRTAVVLHGNEYIYDVDFNIQKYLQHIDVLGCRSLPEALAVKDGLSLEKIPFVCYSGIPDKYIEKASFNMDKFNDLSTLKLCFVGRLVKYKNVDLLIKTISKCQDIPCQLNIVGEGAEKESLRKLSVSLGVSDRVVFHGRKSRDEVLHIMQSSHLFTMISKGEVFGLTYLEGMIASCIPIGSLGEGIDGVIIDGENGFLVCPNDEKELVEKIRAIYSGNTAQMVKIAMAAFNTATQFTDTNVARLYLDNVMKGN